MNISIIISHLIIATKSLTRFLSAVLGYNCLVGKAKPVKGEVGCYFLLNHLSIISLS